MDVAGAEALRQRIEGNQGRGRPSEQREDERALLARAARPDIFDDLDDDEDDVAVRPALRQWLEHHNRTAGNAPAPVGRAANGGGAGALSQRISEQHERRSQAPVHDPSDPTGAETATAVAVERRSARKRRLALPRWEPATVVLSVALSIGAALITSLALQKPTSAAPSELINPEVARVAPAAIPGAAVALHGLASYNPYGTGPEHSAEAPRATDGNPASYWSTETYYNDGFRKPGTGLVVETAGAARLAHLTLQTDTPGFEAQIRVSDSPAGAFRPDSAWETVAGRAAFSLRGLSGRYWLVWLRLPSHQGVAHVNELRATT